MIRKEIKYKDWDDKDQVEVRFFHISEPEFFEMMVEMGIENPEDLNSLLKKIIETKDHAELLRIFKKIVLMSVGERSEDGVHFRKTDEIRENFASTNAYNVLYVELATDDEKAAEFINGIAPKQKKDQDKPVNPPVQATAEIPPAPATT